MATEHEKEQTAAFQAATQDDKCENCGACKHCGAGGRQQFIPMPYPVYPNPYAQPYRPYPYTQPMRPWLGGGVSPNICGGSATYSNSTANYNG